MAWVRKENREGERGELTTMQESCLWSPCIELDPHDILLSENQTPMAKGNNLGAGGEKTSGHYQSAICTAGGKLDVQFV